MIEQVRIKVAVETGVVGGDYEDEIYIGYEEWEAKSPQEKDEFLNEVALDMRDNYISCAAWVEGTERYTRERISRELSHTASGFSYYGNALRAAKDLPELTAEDRSLLDRWAAGGQKGMDGHALQDLAIKIRQEENNANK